MKRDKWLIIQKATYTLTETGGSRATWVTHWQGWASVEESTYRTAMEESQWAGNKSIKINVRKFPVTGQINSSYRVNYRGIVYLIGSVRELDRFTLEIIASTKLRDT